MESRGFTPQTAIDEVLGQASKIDNRVPQLTAWVNAYNEAAAEAMREGKAIGRVGTEDDVSTARAVQQHALELRAALVTLESVAEDIIDADADRKQALLDGFLS